MRSFALLLFLTVLLAPVHAQQIGSPGFAFRSHETLDILSLTNTEDELILNLEITSYLENSEFCIDRNTFILLPSGERLRLKSAEGMPYCPKGLNFEDFGETRGFSLRFPALPGGTFCFDLIEDCRDNCIRIIGIINNTGANELYTRSMDLYHRGDFKAALKGFEELLATLPAGVSLTGSIYGQMIFILYENGMIDEARKRARELEQLMPPYYPEIIQDLKSRTAPEIWQ
jgi:tetratricopeptide (TPR) repeat protein